MISFHKRNDIELELDVLCNAYEHMSITEKVNFINCLCSFRTYDIVSKMYADMCTLKNL